MLYPETNPIRTLLCLRPLCDFVKSDDGELSDDQRLNLNASRGEFEAVPLMFSVTTATIDEFNSSFIDTTRSPDDDALLHCFSSKPLLYFTTRVSCSTITYSQSVDSGSGDSDATTIEPSADNPTDVDIEGAPVNETSSVSAADMLQ